ncbi:MAG: UDP-N-acetylmuramyl-tripeptide synthetase [Gammaproteobacteria bacterium]|nr:UDP-N-acetylmuramyl-tripeptide synthetase [Gammaproteobacteria bacterium]
MINRDDEFFGELEATCRADQVLSYSTHDHNADVYCASVDFRPNGFDAEIVTPWGGGQINSSLLGDFNVSNVLAAVAVLGLLGSDINDICRWAREIEGASGRMDLIKPERGPAIVIDYAHTPDALEKALLALARHKNGRLYCIVGCGGDRDTGKRPLMGSLAARLADQAILTSDNPRGEEPLDIIKAMMADIEGAANVRAIVDRAEAIRTALEEAGEGDVVLIAGKGHEEYQDIAGRHLPFSDYDEVRKYLGHERGGRNGSEA